MTTTERDLTQEVIDGIPEDDSRPVQPDLWVSSNGITFRIRPVSPHITMDAGRNMPQPEVPRIYIKDDDRWEDNPSDPEYVKAVREWRQRAGELSNAIMMTRGAELVLPLPEGIEGPEDTDWSDDLRDFGGLEIPDRGRKRFYAWVKYVALPTLDDFAGLYFAIASKSGMTREADVAQAVDNFRNLSAGGEDNESPVEEAPEHGDSDPA